jgi:hypothetical protein
VQQYLRPMDCSDKDLCKSCARKGCSCCWRTHTHLDGGKGEALWQRALVTGVHARCKVDETCSRPGHSLTTLAAR